MAILIDGRAVSAHVRGKIATETRQFIGAYGRAPGLAVVRVGEDAASQVYVRNKLLACEQVGFVSVCRVLPQDSTTELVLSAVKELNNDPSVDGLLVQLPLPKGIDESAVVSAVAPEKDVDAFHSLDAGHLSLAPGNTLPCTPAGIMTMLAFYGIPVAGRECVIIGRSNIVGRPMAALMLAADATVTVAHSRTANLPEVARRADILISAVGRAGLVRADMVKPGAVVVDVGMNRNENGKLCGDVDFDGVSAVASYITPVPGGVGPMTVTTLLQNTLYAAQANAGR